MSKEELINRFSTAIAPYFQTINNERTRENIIMVMTKVVIELQHEAQEYGGILYSLKKRFVDLSTPKQIDRGEIDIKVELINGDLITIDEYCDLLTNKEKYQAMLLWGINNFFDNNKY